MGDAASYPDGIGPQNEVGSASGLRTWLPLIVLAGVLLLALSGALGGRPNPVIEAHTGGGALSLKAPHVLRNGEFFEMRVVMEARQDMAEPVLAVSAQYLRDLTINSMIPAPAEEGFADGYFTFTYAPLGPGESLEVKIDGQVNPPLVGRNSGAMEWRDGEQVLARLDPSLLVLP